MSIVEFMEDIKTFIAHNDKFALHCGIELVDAAEGEACARMVVDNQHLNGLKTAHGGVIFTLADLAFAAAANSRGQTAVGINAVISYIRPALPGDTLYARAREIYSNKTISGYSVEVENEAGRLVACFQGTAFKKVVIV